MQRKRQAAKSPPDATRFTDPKNAGENAAVNDANIDATGDRVGRAAEKGRRADTKDRKADQSSSSGSC